MKAKIVLKDSREDLLKHDAEVIAVNDGLIAENKRLRDLVGTAFDRGAMWQGA